MVLRTDTVLLEHGLAELVHALGLLAPLISGEVAVLEHRASGGIAPHLGDHHDVLTADGRSQPRDVLDLRPHGVPRIVLVQVLEDRARGQLQVALGQFVGQLLRIGRQIAERAHFDPLVAGCGHLVQEAGIGRLVRVLGKPHTPGVGGRTNENCAHGSLSAVRRINKGALNSSSSPHTVRRRSGWTPTWRPATPVRPTRTGCRGRRSAGRSRHG